MQVNPKELEQRSGQALLKFTENAQNTHTLELQQSVIAVIKRLMTTYCKQSLSREQRAQESETLLKSITDDLISHNVLALEKKDVFLAQLKSLAASENSHFDNINGEVILVSDTFRCFIPALRDQEQYIDNSTYSDRLKKFYNAVLGLYNDKLCTTGIRHELIPILHCSYRGVYLLVELQSSIVNLVREYYENKLLVLLKDATAQEHVFDLICRMNKIDANTEDFYGDQQHLKNFITSRLEQSLNLNYSEATKLIPKLDNIVGTVIVERETISLLPNGYQALLNAFKSFFENKIAQKTLEPQFKQCKTFADFVKYCYPYFAIEPYFDKVCFYANIIAIGSEEGKLQLAAKALRDAIKATGYPKEFHLSPTEFDSFLKRIDQLVDEFSEAYQTAKSSFNNIENSFALLFGTDNQATVSSLYNKFVNIFLNNKMALNDQEIQQLLTQSQEVENHEVVIVVTPLTINRVLWQALTSSPMDWTPLFCTALKTILNFIKKPHADILAVSFKNSYPKSFTDQLDWLLLIKETTVMVSVQFALPCNLDKVLCGNYIREITSLPMIPVKEVSWLFGLTIDRLISSALAEDVNYETAIALIRRLPLNERFNFACKLRALNSEITFVRMLAILQLLPEEQILDFIKSHEKAVETPNALIRLLRKTPEALRFDVAILYEAKIHNRRMADEIFYLLPDHQKLKFATAQQDKITSFLDLLIILATLPEKDRLIFATTHIARARSGLDLAHLVETLATSDRRNCARDNQYLIGSAKGLTEIASRLPKDQRISFIVEQIRFIQNGMGLASVLDILEPVDRLSLAHTYESKINNSAELAAVLKVLPEESRYDFFLRNVSRLTAEDFSEVIKSLPKSYRLDLAEKHRDKILDAELETVLECTLLPVMSTQPALERSALALKHQSLINDGYRLADVIEAIQCVNISDRADKAILRSRTYLLAYANQRKIKDGDQLFFVIKELRQSDRFSIAALNHSKITGIAQLYELVKVLGKKNSLRFVTCYHNNLIKNTIDLQRIIGSIHNRDRLEFLSLFNALFSKFDELIPFFQFLLPENACDFALSHLDKIKNPAQAKAIIGLLPKEKKFDFQVQYCKNRLLENVSAQQARDETLQEHQTIAEEIKHFRNI